MTYVPSIRIPTLNRSSQSWAAKAVNLFLSNLMSSAKNKKKTRPCFNYQTKIKKQHCNLNSSLKILFCLHLLSFNDIYSKQILVFLLCAWIQPLRYCFSEILIKTSFLRAFLPLKKT